MYTKRLSPLEINLALKKIAHHYPGITNLQFEGYSEQCRPIYSVSIGNGAKSLICTAGVHGRESINPTVLVNMTEFYCKTYTNKSVLITDLLNHYKITFLPLLNPDGYEIALKTRCDWKYNANAVDINRDFPCQSYRPETPEDHPFSARESQILKTLFHRESGIGYLDFHSRGEEIYWHRAALDESYNQRQKILAQTLADSSGYRLGTKEDETKGATRGGNTVQYYSETFRLPAITIETIPEEASFPLSETWLLDTYEKIKELPIKYLEHTKILKSFTP